MTHILVITGVEDEREYAIECPGGTLCRRWLECAVCSPVGTPRDIVELDDEMYDADGLAHGVVHQRFSWGWCVPDDGACFVRDNDGMPDAAQDIDRDRLAPGRYPVDFDVVDETDLMLSLQEPPNEPQPAAQPEERTE